MVVLTIPDLFENEYINRQLLRRSSYDSVQELENDICKFIEQYNEISAKPFKWMYHIPILVAG